MTRTTNDVDAIGESLTRGVVGLISDALIILGTLAMMLWLNPFHLGRFSISPLLIWTVNLCRKQLRNLFTSIRESLSSLNGLFAEYINGAARLSDMGLKRRLITDLIATLPLSETGIIGRIGGTRASML